ncbi:hypothetical protein K501DRAFT_269735 [Backusella circina FSU 941]|nr:hypothetical protein K501DRAFT_269735 [Backusella circina FSU 941]
MSSYRDNNTVELNLKNTLRAIVNDPNALKGCQKKANDWLTHFQVVKVAGAARQVNNNSGKLMTINQATTIIQNSDSNKERVEDAELSQEEESQTDESSVKNDDTIPDSQSSASTTDDQPTRTTRTLVESETDNNSDNSDLQIYAQLRTDTVILPADVLTWAGTIQDAIDLNDRYTLERRFGETLINATEHKQGRVLDTVHAMINITNMLIAHKPVLKGSEDTFVHYSVAPLLNNTFYGNQLGSFWANKQLVYSSSSPMTEMSPARSSSASPTTEKSAYSKGLKPSKKQPDFTTYTSFGGNRYDLFVVEIKPPQSSLSEDDFTKITKQMMTMLSRLVELRVPDPSVYELDNFELIKTLDDLAKIKPIMQKLFKVKDGVDKIAIQTKDLLKKRKAHEKEVEVALCRLDWTRDPFPSHRVKKAKKNNV